ncbi:hypothetical protein [Nostoc sp. CHAB 5715]|uniref:hypothetical protein n=1 Tax=Nostoc sp. CHAB 5715 TaxID=2780400 RepID=UPI001E291B80|nr:hypothetical protein [Nostoc sp. CHAB 5715]MCC5623673.1 hypothetical protein [Nostoc sp. CHAB 5715]
MSKYQKKFLSNDGCYSNTTAITKKHYTPSRKQQSGENKMVLARQFSSFEKYAHYPH